jgi:hypothetical protein
VTVTGFRRMQGIRHHASGGYQGRAEVQTEVADAKSSVGADVDTAPTRREGRGERSTAEGDCVEVNADDRPAPHKPGNVAGDGDRTEIQLLDDSRIRLLENGL